MIKYFIRHYWRYLAMALAFATISFLINSCEVNAETNYNQSITINYSETSNNADRILYNDPNHTNKAFANAGRGYLVGIISSYNYYTNASFEIPTVNSINARTDSGYSTCEVSSLANTMNDNTQMKANLYGFKCDLTMSTNGLISLSVNFKPNVTNSWTVESYRLTFNNNLEAQEVQYSQYLYDYMQNYVYPRLNGIENNTGATSQELQWIYSYLQNYIYLSQQNSINELQDINDKLDELMSQNQVCYIIDKNKIKDKGKILNAQGTYNTQEDQNFGTTDYIKITKTTKIKKILTSSINLRYCFYDSNKTFISCNTSGNTQLNTNITIPNNSYFIKITINEGSNRPQYEICDTTQNITNQQNEQIIDSQKETNDTLKDSSVDDPDSDLSDMEDQVASNSVISDLLLLPVNMFQRILNSINGTCSSFNLGSLFGTNLVLPCINIENIIGSGLWTTIDILFCGIFILSIRKKFVDIFENITSLKDRGNELE